ncbi:AraC family transcriptional regulator [Zobellella denitrificans]|uniref:AraC family transcriptional regulator n=1 Tax=Zobellella denitrificans TaxID=347534 RepID=UPI000B8C0AE1|nr:helix-turn-helix transcriptional regulator [Zobellella denitrificans]OXS14085.1 AraC family transcriptional regulator [Zobellella denitrificans]
MKCLSTDNARALLQQLEQLPALPRPVLGHTESLPNQAIGLPHRHPWVQLSYAERGVITVETTDARYLAPPSLAVWIPPGLEHSVRLGSKTRIRSLYIAADALPARGCQVLDISPLLRELIVAFSHFPVEYDDAGAEGRLVRVLLDQLAAAPSRALLLPWPRDPRLQPLCRQLAAQPDCALPLGHFSAQLGLSDKTLSRAFRMDTGMSFRQWRQRCRLLAALPLLEQGERITDVALACGYDSLSAFIAAFRALLGRTPGDYLQQG